jgi:hypothetical protein
MIEFPNASDFKKKHISAVQVIANDNMVVRPRKLGTLKLNENSFQVLLNSKR